MSRFKWWATFIGLTVRDAALAGIGSWSALEFIPDRTVAVNVAILIPAVFVAIWTCIAVSIARSHWRGRRGGAR